ncbi:MAG: hypothetical protein IRZ14_20520 [Chloroflexi bacterium]|nr:hypothetical protein [Chloroflexota bacterium]
MSGAEALRAQASSRSAPGLWYGLLGGHAAWSAQLLLSYLVISLACRDPAPHFTILGADGFQLLLGVLTLLPAAVALGAIAVALRHWRAERAPRAETTGSGDVQGFLGLFGALLSGLFTATILLTGVSLLYLAPCR